MRAEENAVPNGQNGEKRGIRHLKIKFMMGWSVEIETDTETIYDRIICGL